jgi:DNA-binding transcriptional LysR family regulator
MKKGTGYRILTDGFCREAGFTPNISCEVDNSTVIASFVNSGMGIAILTEPAKRHEPSLVLIPIEQPVCQRTFQLSWLKNHYLSQAALTFRDYLIKYYKDEG